MVTFGLHLTTYPTAKGGLLSELRDIAASIEESGAFSTLWLTDHVQQLGPEGPTSPMPEAYLTLAAIAACTSALHLGVLATSVLYRTPPMLAKMVTTLDAISGGRAVLGIGAGHPRTEAEVRAYGYDFPAVGQRMAMLESALVVIRSMVGPEVVNGAPPNWPRPVQSRGIAILVAGSGEQRLLRIAAQYADMINLSSPSGDTLDRLPHKLEVLAAHCATVGRDPADITVTYKAAMAVASTTEQAQRIWDAGRGSRGVGELDASAGVFVGTPSDVAAQMQPFIDGGVDHLVVELLGGADPDSIALAARAAHRGG